MKEAKNAVIYCRVSSDKQVKKADGLGSQETRCRDYAKHQGHEIVEVFRDEGISGGLIDRPAMQEMLRYLSQRKRSNIPHVVIIDDVSRLARGVHAHLELRMAIDKTVAELESPSLEFGDDPDSQLVENLLASVYQHQRQKNAEQVKNRMWGRMKNGYWVFHAPPGYRYEMQQGCGRVLLRDEPVASIIQQALKGFASGRFETQFEVKRFLEMSADFPKSPKGTVYFTRVAQILTTPLYSGYIDYPNWDIILQEGKHEALITYEEFLVIQNCMKKQAKAPMRKDISNDFPLRGFVKCDHCDRPMTSCWTKGVGGRYPYYFCHNKQCTEYKKSIRGQAMEEQFEQILQKTVQPAPVINIFRTMLKEQWQNRKQHHDSNVKGWKSEISLLDKKVGNFMDRICSTDSPTLINTYENHVKKLEEQKLVLGERISANDNNHEDFDKTFRTAFEFLSNPHKHWVYGDLYDKKLVQKLVFHDSLRYDRFKGFRTPTKSLPFSALDGLTDDKSVMVGGNGFEPLTFSV